MALLWLGGATIPPPCINRSLHLTDLKGRDLYLGFIHVKGISEQLVMAFLLERGRAGSFASLTDFCTRVRADLPSRLHAVRDRETITLLAYFVCDKIVLTVKGVRKSFGC